jgi:hypothetical protein
MLFFLSASAAAVSCGLELALKKLVFLQLTLQAVSLALDRDYRALSFAKTPSGRTSG